MHINNDIQRGVPTVPIVLTKTNTMDKEESTFSYSDIHKLAQSYSQDIKPQAKHSTPTPALSQGFVMSKMWYFGIIIAIIVATLALVVAFANLMITQRDTQCLLLESSNFNGGGVVYTKWGSSSCPNTIGTELVYSGIMGVSKAGASCLPEDPEYTLPGEESLWNNQIITIHSGRYKGYQNKTISRCAVCASTTKKTILMIPAKTSCPSSWTREYYGYLMTSAVYNNDISMFVCFDRAASSYLKNDYSYLYTFRHTRSSCDIDYGGLPCPPYNSTKIINCVVCTK